jgi:hypothetical protein
MLTNRYCLMSAASLAALFLMGCQKDEITHYQVPKEDRSQRLLAVIFNHGEETWFFKLVGSPSLVAKYKDDFDRFVRSVRFTGREETPLRYQAPAGWKELEPDKSFGQVAGFRIREGDQSATLSVAHAGGDLLANINRWRGQIGLEQITGEQLRDVTEATKINGDQATLVDMTSTGRNAARTEAARAPLKYTVPPGWQEIQTRGSFQLAAFVVTEGDQSAKVTVSRLGGGVLDNVNRWRQQDLDLEPVNDEQLPKLVQKIEVGGLPGHYVDLTGPAKAGKPAPQRILGVIVPQRGQSWFFKMIGPADMVGKQKAAFEAFVRSVQFPGARHG